MNQLTSEKEVNARPAGDLTSRVPFHLTIVPRLAQVTICSRYFPYRNLLRFANIEARRAVTSSQTDTDLSES
jgi:hypothetical protein